MALLGVTSPDNLVNIPHGKMAARTSICAYQLFYVLPLVKPLTFGILGLLLKGSYNGVSVDPPKRLSAHKQMLCGAEAVLCAGASNSRSNQWYDERLSQLLGAPDLEIVGLNGTTRISTGIPGLPQHGPATARVKLDLVKQRDSAIGASAGEIGVTTQVKCLKEKSKNHSASRRARRPSNPRLRHPALYRRDQDLSLHSVQQDDSSA